VRAEMNVPPGAKPPLTVIGANAETKARLARHRDLLLTLARLDSAREADVAPTGAVPFVLGEATGALAIAEFIDLTAEKARLAKEIAGHVGEIEKAAKKLNNPDFLARAKEEAIEENRERLADAEAAAKAKLEAGARRRGDDRPAIGGYGRQEFGRASYGFDPLDVLDLGLGDGPRLGLGVDARQADASDSLHCPPAMDSGQEGLDVQPVPPGPVSPHPLRRHDRGQDGAVHVEQEGGEFAIRKQGNGNQGELQSGLTWSSNRAWRMSRAIMTKD
jgi:hypothetical protein